MVHTLTYSLNGPSPLYIVDFIPFHCELDFTLPEHSANATKHLHSKILDSGNTHRNADPSVEHGLHLHSIIRMMSDGIESHRVHVHR